MDNSFSSEEEENYSSEEENEVNSLKLLLNLEPKKNEKMNTNISKQFSPRGKNNGSENGSLNNSGKIFEEMEKVYREMERREKDYAIAVEIGKMLLDKNNELQEKNVEIQRQFDNFMNERRGENDDSIHLREENLILSEKVKSLKRSNKELRLEVSLAEKGKDSSEMRAIVLSEEFERMENKLQTSKVELKSTKKKNATLLEELEVLKEEIQLLKDSNLNFKMQNQKNKENSERIPQQLEASSSEEEEDRFEKEGIELMRLKYENEIYELKDELERIKILYEEKEDELKREAENTFNWKKDSYRREKENQELKSILEEKNFTINKLNFQMEEIALIESTTNSSFYSPSFILNNSNISSNPFENNSLLSQSNSPMDFNNSFVENKKNQFEDPNLSFVSSTPGNSLNRHSNSLLEELLTSDPKAVQELNSFRSPIESSQKSPRNLNNVSNFNSTEINFQEENNSNSTNSVLLNLLGENQKENPNFLDELLNKSFNNQNQTEKSPKKTEILQEKPSFSRSQTVPALLHKPLKKEEKKEETSSTIDAINNLLGKMPESSSSSIDSLLNHSLPSNLISELKSDTATFSSDSLFESLKNEKEVIQINPQKTEEKQVEEIEKQIEFSLSENILKFLDPTSEQDANQNSELNSLIQNSAEESEEKEEDKISIIEELKNIPKEESESLSVSLQKFLGDDPMTSSTSSISSLLSSENSEKVAEEKTLKGSNSKSSSLSSILYGSDGNSGLLGPSSNFSPSFPSSPKPSSFNSLNSSSASLSSEVKRSPILPSKNLSFHEERKTQVKKEEMKEEDQVDEIKRTTSAGKEEEWEGDDILTEEEEILSRLAQWKLRISSLQNQNAEAQRRKDRINSRDVSSEETEWLLREFQKNQNRKNEEIELLVLLCELKKKLLQGDWKNNESNGRSSMESVSIANSTLQEISKTISSKVLSRKLIGELDSLRFASDLLLEHCRLRKLCNVLEEEKSGKRNQEKGFWDGPIHSFFGGWKKPTHSLR